MPRIGIDARLYGVGSGTGIGRYTQELLRRFLGMTNDQCPMSNDLEFVVFLRRDGYETFNPPNERWTKVLADFRPYSLGVQTGYPRIIRQAGVDLMHFTHFDHPIRCPVPFIVTIHDLILLNHPSIRASTLGPLRFWMKYAAYRRVLRHAIDTSIRILTPSQTIKEQIAARFGILREKIIATPLGIDHTAVFQIPDSPPKADPPLEDRFQIPASPYLLYIGNAYPHKNLEQLIRVMPALRERHPDLRLVLVSREDDFSRRLNRESLKRTPIVFTGAVRESELRSLMAGAAVYVSPSRDEGFDLPTVEALVAGTPVVASDIPTHREILGDVFVPFLVDDDTALTDAIHRTLIHSDIHATLRDRGIERARQFSWRTCAGITLSAYREALAWLDHEPQRTDSGVERADLRTASPPPSSSPTSTRG